jgi:multidrug efflux system outer membrane protein
MIHYINRWFLFLPLLFLAACSVSKDVVKPEPVLPAAFRNSTDTGGTSIGLKPWRELLHDAALQQLIDTALVNNYDMQIAAQNIQAAQLVLRQSKWGYVPDVRLQVSAGSTRPSDNSLNGISASQFLGTTHIEDFNAGLNLSWEADIWGKVRNQQKSARAAYQQTDAARKALQTRIVASVAQGYYNLLMLDAQMAIARRNLSLNDSTLRIVRLQYEAGQVSALAVQQTEAQQLVAAQLVPALEQNITIQENALSVLAGKLPAPVQRGSTLSGTDLPDNYKTGLPSSMLSLRPDVQGAALQLTINNARVGIAQANMYPSLTITAGGGVNAFKASNWFNIPASLFGAVAGGITQPLLQRRQLKTQYELAKTEREKSVILFRQSVMNAVGEVSDALVKLEQLDARSAIALKRTQTLQLAIANANMLFSSGMASYLEVITAQGNLLQSELDLATLKREQLSAAIDLYRSLGGGWQ